MSRLNRIILIGKVKEKAEQKVTNSGDSYANFTLIVDRPAVENIPAKTDELSIVCWRELATEVSQYEKESLLLVSGSIRTRNFENNEGKRIYVTEVEAREVKQLSSSAQQQIESNDIPVFEENLTAEPSSQNFDFNEAIKMEQPATELGESVPF